MSQQQTLDTSLDAQQEDQAASSQPSDKQLNPVSTGKKGKYRRDKRMF